MKPTKLILIFYIFSATASMSFAANSKTLYTSLNPPKKSIELTNHKFKSSLLIDENCSNCTALIRKLGNKCTSFKGSNFVVFATGSSENLKKKLKPLLKMNALVYTHSDIETLLETGASALPSYFSKSGKLFAGTESTYDAILKDKICAN